MRIVNIKDVGPPNTPHEIKRLRRQATDYLRRQGQPIVHLHFLNPDDVRKGIAEPCPLSYNSTYNHSRSSCPVCFGVGFVTIADDPTRWITDDGKISTEPTNTPMPRYGGFSDPALTWAVLPDAAIDVYMFNDAGVLTRTQQAQAFTYWTPDMQDNDLIIAVEIASNGRDVIGQQDRWQAKQVMPQTLRGFGRRATYQQHKVGQQFEMTLIDQDSPFWEVPIGGSDYGTS